MLIAFLVFMVLIVVIAILRSETEVSNISNSIKNGSSSSTTNEPHKSKKLLEPVQDHGLSEEEIIEVEDDRKHTAKNEFATDDGNAEGYWENSEIVWVRLKGGKKYNSFEELFRNESIPKETYEELLDIQRRLVNVQRYLGRSHHTNSSIESSGKERKVSSGNQLLTENNEKGCNNRVFVWDEEKYNFDTDSFASFLDYVTHIVLHDIDDIVLRGYEGSSLSEMEPMLQRGYLEAHLERLVPYQTQFVIFSDKLKSKLQIKFSPSGSGLEIQSLDTNSEQGLYQRLTEFRGPWGVFSIVEDSATDTSDDHDKHNHSNQNVVNVIPETMELTKVNARKEKSHKQHRASVTYSSKSDKGKYSNVVMENLDISEIESTINDLANQLDYPQITHQDYQILFNGFAEMSNFLIAYLDAHYSQGRGLEGHNRTYWWFYMGVVARTYYLMGECAYNLKNYDDVIDWIGLSVTASDDKQHLENCDLLCSKSMKMQGKLIPRTFSDYSQMNPMDINERAEELINIYSRSV